MKKLGKKFGFLILFGFALLTSIVGIKQAKEQYVKINYYKPNYARILSSQVLPERPEADDTQYRPDIRYTYEAEGRLHTNDTVTPVYQSGEYSWAKKIVDQYIPGGEYLVYYNPNNPADAFLLRIFNFSPYLTIMFSLIFIILLLSSIIPKTILYRRKRALEMTEDWNEILIPNLISDNFTTFFYNTLVSLVIGFITLGHYFTIVEPPYEKLSFTVAAIWAMATISLAFNAYRYFIQLSSSPQVRLFSNKRNFQLGDTVNILIKINFKKIIEVTEYNIALICNEISQYRADGNNLTQFVSLYNQNFPLLNEHTSKNREALEAIKKFSFPQESPRSQQSLGEIQWGFQLIFISPKGKPVVTNIPIHVSEK